MERFLYNLDPATWRITKLASHKVILQAQAPAGVTLFDTSKRVDVRIAPYEFVAGHLQECGCVRVAMVTSDHDAMMAFEGARKIDAIIPHCGPCLALVADAREAARRHRDLMESILWGPGFGAEYRKFVESPDFKRPRLYGASTYSKLQ